jgi:type II secretory ATPase GspE/PulE/Tfp pilus assembly ATPase PilB-like protein/CheY-like chemotaxis protein
MASAPFRVFLRMPETNRSARAPWTDRWLLEAARESHPDIVARVGPAANACDALHEAGMTPDQLASLVAHVAGVPMLDVSGVGPGHAGLLPAVLAQRFDVVPVRVDGKLLEVATPNPLREHLERDLSFASARTVRLGFASPGAVQAARGRVYAAQHKAAAAPRMVWGDVPGNAGQDAAMTRGAAAETLERLVTDAVDQRASDIHMEPQQGGAVLVRYRVDGALHDVSMVAADLAPLLISRLKVSAGLDIANRLRPQDGRANVRIDGRSIDLRISTLPLGERREKAVIRILDASSTTLDFSALGFSDPDVHLLRQVLSGTEGMVLVTGPTGSGKTTTLYTALQALRNPKTNIVTVEDPIEYRLEGINQVQVHDKTGLTFATALRSILRQDPDVVLVGEIRDRDTADIAVRAAMTGHLVLSTLHTGDAAGAVNRLADIGVDGASIAGALRAVIAQRLLRRLCPECAAPADASTAPAQYRWILEGHYTKGMRRPVGCPACRQTGYRGRFAIVEVLVIDEESQQLMTRATDRVALLQMARRSGMKTLWDVGLQRVLEGMTDFEELATTVTPPLPEATMSQDAVDALLGHATADPSEPEAATRTPSGGQPVQPDVAIAPVAYTPRVTRPVVLASRPPADVRPRVLIVHDDALSRRALRLAFDSAGFTVVEAADGDAGLAYALRLRPALLVTDFALPGLDGIGLGQAVRAEGACEHVVACTGQTDPALFAWALEVGFAEIVSVRSDLSAVARRLFSEGAAESAETAA